MENLWSEPDHASLSELPENAPRYVVLSHTLVSPTLPCDCYHGLGTDPWDRNTTTQTHKDGRVSYPLVLINWSEAKILPTTALDELTSILAFPRAPSSSPTDLMMLHTSGLTLFQSAAECSKVSGQLRRRSALRHVHLLNDRSVLLISGHRDSWWRRGLYNGIRKRETFSLGRGRVAGR